MGKLRKTSLVVLSPLGALILLTIASVSALIPLHTHAEGGTSVSTDVSIGVGLACTLRSSATSHSVTLSNGLADKDIPGATLRVICDGNGNYNIYAIGYTNNTDGNNTLDGGASGIIPTGTTLDGTASNWAMKLSNSAGNTAVIKNGYSGFSLIPSAPTLVASYNSTLSNPTTDSTLQATYGISISPNQPAGTYTGQVKYTMNYTEYEITYIQDLTLEKCSVNVGEGDNPANIGDTITVYDKRDGNDYTVRYINGACWMTQNLRITGTITSTDSNYSGADYNISANDLVTNGTTDGNCYGINGYTHPCTKDSGDNTIGVWYNYCAATVGTICSSSTSAAATEDICPAGWHLPTGAAYTATSELYKLFQSTSANTWITANGYLNAFGAVAGGYYYNGSLYYATTHGYWWPATAYDTTERYTLGYISSDNQFCSYHGNRVYGLFVRCVRTS